MPHPHPEPQPQQLLPSQRRPQPQRELRSAAARLLLGGLFLLLGLVTVGIGLFEWGLEIAYSTTGRTVQGAVVEAWRSGSGSRSGYYLSYRFTPPGGAMREGRRSVHWAIFDRHKEGGPVTVQYLPARPFFNRVLGQGEWSNIPWLLAIGALLTVSGIPTFRQGWRQRREERYLRTSGTPTIGVITAMTETVYRWKNQQLWSVEYRYTDQYGEEHAGTYDTLPAGEAEGWHVGDQMELRYHPERPEVSLWMGRG